ncbi:MAG: hypothetical protein ABIF08_02170 [Nanoarchaeota archaeon]
MRSMFHNKCPLCGTSGKNWQKKPEVFVCPSCSSVFSRFGLVLETQNETQELWN